MRLLRVIPSLDPKGGGPVEGIKQQQGPLSQMGCEVEIACCDTLDSAWLSSGDLPMVHPLGPATNNYGYSSRFLPWLKTNASHYDAVVVHGIWQYHGLAVRRALAGTSTPYYVFPHGMLDPWFKQAYPIKHLKKWLYWLGAEYRVLRDARRVIFTSENERLLARESFPLYRVNETVTAYGILPPPTDEERLAAEFLARHPHLQGKRIALYLGRIHEKKGCDLLIEAFADVAKRHEDLHLVIAGPDPADWVTGLKKLAQTLGIAQRITWTGMLQGDMKWGAFHAAEVFCLPSHQENFGIAVVEALACGKPVLISDKVNIWREIDADGAGWVERDTMAGARRNFEHWLALERQELAAMQARAKQCYMNRFQAGNAAADLINIIQSSRQ